jgi:outer membrane protein OmpA-like peptidoglycan-associated protein
MYGLGMYSLLTLKLSGNNLEFYFPFNFHSLDPDGKQTMDALYDYLTTKPVNYNYRTPQKGIFFSF